jgi:putative transcriptional regulator
MATGNSVTDDMFEAILSSVAILNKVGALDKATMRNLDVPHLAVPNEIEPAEIKQLHGANNVNQLVSPSALELQNILTLRSRSRI